jgi:hypothetical protein
MKAPHAFIDDARVGDSKREPPTWSIAHVWQAHRWFLALSPPGSDERLVGVPHHPSAVCQTTAWPETQRHRVPGRAAWMLGVEVSPSRLRSVGTLAGGCAGRLLEASQDRESGAAWRHDRSHDHSAVAGGPGECVHREDSSEEVCLVEPVGTRTRGGAVWESAVRHDRTAWAGPERCRLAGPSVRREHRAAPQRVRTVWALGGGTSAARRLSSVAGESRHGGASAAETVPGGGKSKPLGVSRADTRPSWVSEHRVPPSRRSAARKGCSARPLSGNRHQQRHQFHLPAVVPPSRLDPKSSNIVQ